jgi:hypothetical protein
MLRIIRNPQIHNAALLIGKFYGTYSYLPALKCLESSPYLKENTQLVTTANINSLKGVIAVYSDNRTKPIGTKYKSYWLLKLWYIQLPFGFEGLNF